MAVLVSLKRSSPSPKPACRQRQTVYAVTSLTSAQDLARLAREHWSIEAHHHIRDSATRGFTLVITISHAAELAVLVTQPSK
jgi:hypothetical protein